MPSIIPGFEYDIFISYRQKDNKHDGWVTEFVNNLKGELESTFKEEISVYFDINPHDGLLETHDVDASLKDKLKCLVFIPVISRTYCDPKSFAWEHEYKAFVEQASHDQFGLKIKLPNGNVANRVLPIRIHDLDAEDVKCFEGVAGGVMRTLDFVFKTVSGVNRPLKSKEDHPNDNINKSFYSDQINKVALAIKEIFLGLKTEPAGSKVEKSISREPGSEIKKKGENKKLPGKTILHRKLKKRLIVSLLVFLCLTGVFAIIKFTGSTYHEKSIAVLPFDNLSNDPDQEYFSDGMVDAILDHLFKVGELKVISRTSSMRYKNTKLTLKEIAHELDVSSLLEGSVQKIGNKVRITTQLIDPKTGFHLWSETYDRDLSDILSIQSEVALNVARALKTKLSSEEIDLIQSTIPTTSQLAYDFYLKGNDYFSRLKYLNALDMYSNAIKEDSLFTAAYANRAKVHLNIYWNKEEDGWQIHGLEAQEDIKKGLLLNPELPELKLAQAVAYYYLDRDYDKALEILKDLKAKTPNITDIYTYISYILRRQGKWEESIGEQKLAMKLDPFNLEYIINLLYTYELQHQYDDLIELARQGLSFVPDYQQFNLEIFKACLNKTGDLIVALKESGLKEIDVQNEVYYYTRQYDKLLESIKVTKTYLWERYGNLQMEYYPEAFKYAFIYYLNGNKSLCKLYSDSAITYLKKKIKEIPDDERFYATLGKCYAFNGNVEEAITCGKKAVNLMPVKSDAWQGVIKEQDLMEIYIFTGNYDQAMDKIEYLLSIPSWLSTGQLMIDPIFDYLRSLPRFKRIIGNGHK